MNRRILLIALAVVLALTGTFVVYKYVHNADQRALDKTRAAKVLVAVRTVPAGTSWNDAVRGSYFEQQSVPVDSAPTLALSSTNASVPLEEVAQATISSGQIVLRPMFGQKVSVVGALPIPDKLIAVSFSIDGGAAVAGFIQPQSEVAVFVTYVQNTTGTSATQASGSANKAIKLLFPRVLVLATPATAPDNLSKANGGGGLITLALNQQQAEQMILASQTQTLYLGLLSDTSVTNIDQGVTYNAKFVPVKPA